MAPRRTSRTPSTTWEITLTGTCLGGLNHQPHVCLQRMHRSTSFFFILMWPTVSLFWMDVLCPSHVSRRIHTKYHKIPKGAFSHVDGGKRIQKPLQTDPTRLERWTLPNFWQIRKSSLKQISTQCHLAAGVTQPCGLFQVFILPNIYVYL